MADTSHSFLIDLLAVDGAANAHGCGLEPRLLELLLDRHAKYPGTVILNRPIRHDGPVVARHHACLRAGAAPAPKSNHGCTTHNTGDT